MAEDKEVAAKKEYFPPKIVHTEPLETRAVTCTMADSNTCAQIIQS